MSGERPRVAVFRPDDERIESALEVLESLGTEPVPDPMLAVEPTGAVPTVGADVVVFTSKTGAELVEGADWEPAAETTVAAIGEPTAAALRERGYDVDVVPEEYSSSGLVAELGDSVAGLSVEVARSDHGSDVLLDGLAAAGADVTETVLYRLSRPDEAGESAAMAARGELDAALFTSSLTVEHFLEAAAEHRDGDVDRAATVDGLSSAVVGVIGEPTAETARDAGVEVDVMPETAAFEALARAAVAELEA